MPQEFEQAQSASAGQEVGDIVESAGVQVDGTADALDAVLDDIESVVSCKKAASDAAAARQRQSFLVTA